MSQFPCTSAGPNDRAGFIDVPVTAPPARMLDATVSPIPNPPIFKAFPRSSTAVPMIAIIKRNVMMNSARRTEIPPNAFTATDRTSPFASAMPTMPAFDPTAGVALRMAAMPTSRELKVESG